MIPLKLHKKLLLEVFHYSTNPGKKVPNIPLLNQEETMLHSVIGQANWLEKRSHPDTCFGILNLNSHTNKKPCYDLIDANHMLKKIKTKDSKLDLRYLGLIND